MRVYDRTSPGCPRVAPVPVVYGSGRDLRRDCVLCAVCCAVLLSGVYSDFASLFLPVSAHSLCSALLRFAPLCSALLRFAPLCSALLHIFWPLPSLPCALARAVCLREEIVSASAFCFSAFLLFLPFRAALRPVLLPVLTHTCPRLVFTLHTSHASRVSCVVLRSSDHCSSFSSLPPSPSVCSRSRSRSRSQALLFLSSFLFVVFSSFRGAPQRGCLPHGAARLPPSLLHCLLCAVLCCALPYYTRLLVSFYQSQCSVVL
jgi:hypothetical protein